MQLNITWACIGVLYVVLGIVVSAVLIPFIEEVINRGFLLHYLMLRGRLFAVVLSSIFFAIFHDPVTIPSAFVIGIYFANLTLNSGTLWPATIAHAVHNLLVQIDHACIALAWDETSTHSQIAQSGYSAVVAMFILLFAAALLVSRKVTGARSAPL
jgi:membrane protease YdiL (CAAX protease family)